MPRGSSERGRGGRGYRGGSFQGRGRGRGGHPPGLKGKEIGLWYARQGSEARKKIETENGPELNMNAAQLNSINNVLESIQSPSTDNSRSSNKGQIGTAGYSRYSDGSQETDSRFQGGASRFSEPEGNSRFQGGSSRFSESAGNSRLQGGSSRFSESAGNSRFQGGSSRFSEGNSKSHSGTSSNAENNSQFHDEDDETEIFSASVIEEFNQGWDEAVTSIMEKKFDGEGKMKEELETMDWFEDAMVEDDMVRNVEAGIGTDAEQTDLRAYTNRLHMMEDSKFKRDYVANVQANLLRDSHGMLAKIKEVTAIRNEQMDQQLIEEDQQRRSNSRYKALIVDRKKLPAYKMRKDIMEKICRNQVVVLSGETGCGKTTQVAQFILDDMIADGKGSLCHVVCTQPRRISAISVAQRVADERGEKLGISVGYSIRLESIPSRPKGSIQFCTTGIVLKLMQRDPKLSKVSHLVLDEIHERDTLSDFLICMGKDLIRVRPDLKLILMSATLNADKFTEYYDNCASIHVPGFMFPVKEYYLEDVLEMTGFTFGESRRPKWTERKNQKIRKLEFDQNIAPYVRNLERSQKFSHRTITQLMRPESEDLNHELVFHLIHHICTRMGPGALLVFLTGWDDISKVNRMISDDRTLSGRNYVTYPLHSMMPTTNQREVFSRPPEGVRKIVLATNIAETSITIDDIVYVIDAGKIKMTNYDRETNLSTLLPEWVTLANSRQRRGRAGRVQEGICYHLYTSARENLLDPFPLPEIQRSRLEEVILQIKVLQLGSVKPFLQRIMDPPDPKVIDVSMEMLEAINAVDTDENLTPLGFHLARLPMDPLTGKMVLMGALFSCLRPVLTVAAALSFKDPFMFPLGKEKEVDRIKRILAEDSLSDHYVVVKVYDEWEQLRGGREEWQYTQKNFLSQSVLTQLRNMRNQFMEFLFEHKFVDTRSANSPEVNRNSDNWKLVRAIVTAGLYPNVARITMTHRGAGRLSTATERHVALHPKSVNANLMFPKESERLKKEGASWLVYREKVKSTKVFIHDSTIVTNMPLLFFGQQFRFDVTTSMICVDKQGFVQIKCSKHVAKLVQDLRNELNKLLEYKVSHPGMPEWDRSSKEGALLSTIVDLIISEKVTKGDTQTKGRTENGAVGGKSKGGRGGKRKPELNWDDDDGDYEEDFDYDAFFEDNWEDHQGTSGRGLAEREPAQGWW